jgi:hypothetical protein
MNKRIRELVRESHLDLYGLGKDRDKFEHSIEKFAELIIDECELVVDCDNMYAIKEHFEEKNNGNITAVVKSGSVL